MVRWGIGRERHDKEKDTMNKFMDAQKRRESMERTGSQACLECLVHERYLSVGEVEMWNAVRSWGA